MRGLSIPGQDGLATYQYAGLDRTVKLTYVIPEIELSYISPDGAPGDDAGDPYTGWDRFGRTQDLRWTKGEEILDQTLYGYNRSSQRTWRTAPLATSGNEDEAYQYDGLYQITGRQRGDLNTNHTAIGGIPVRAEAFNYDPIGNWQHYQVSADGTLVLDQTRVHDKANTLTQINSSSALLAHDPAGNMTLCPPPANSEWDEALTLVWDAWNRLTEVRSADGTTLIAKYAYDGLWRRTTRRIGSGPVIHAYYNAQRRPLQETEEDGSTTLARTYDWGIRYRDDLIRRINHLNDDATHYALHDYYNVTAITDATGEVLERYGYSAFGDVRFMTIAYATKPASDHAWDLLYKAQFRDEETGFYNYGYRYLSPMLGRFLSRDPIGEQGGLNLYAFVNNNGVNGTDSLGLISDAAKALIAVLFTTYANLADKKPTNDHIPKSGLSERVVTDTLKDKAKPAPRPNSSSGENPPPPTPDQPNPIPLGGPRIPLIVPIVTVLAITTGSAGGTNRNVITYVRLKLLASMSCKQEISELCDALNIDPYLFSENLEFNICSYEFEMIEQIIWGSTISWKVIESGIYTKPCSPGRCINFDQH